MRDAGPPAQGPGSPFAPATATVDAEGRIVRLDEVLAARFGVASTDAMGRSFDLALGSQLTRADRAQLGALAHGIGTSCQITPSRTSRPTPPALQLWSLPLDAGHRLIVCAAAPTVRRGPDGTAAAPTPDETEAKASLLLGLELALEKSRLSRSSAALLLIDVPELALVAAALGSAVAGTVRAALARRLCTDLGADALLLPLGPGRFGGLIDPTRRAGDAREIARRVVNSVRRPLPLPPGPGDGPPRDTPTSIHRSPAEECLAMRACVGWCALPDDGHHADILLHRAESALRVARAAGGGEVRGHAPRPDLPASLHRTEASLAAGHEGAGRELLLYYQPVVDCKTLQVRAVEALLRLHDPVRGVLPPDAFLPAAEASGLVIQLDSWVLHEACRQAAVWRAEGLALEHIAVNLSARQFARPGLPDLVRDALERSKLRPEGLTLELSEGALGDPDFALQRLGELRQLGVRLAIDRLSADHASLARLSRYPIDVIQIDRHFIADMLEDPRHAAITDTVIALGHVLGVQVHAAGIESPAQLAHLRARGCHSGQGWLLGRPMPPAALVQKLLRDRRA